MAAKSGKRANRKSGSHKKPVSSSKKAGTMMPVGRLNRMIKQGRYASRTGRSAGVFMAAVLEYITAEVLELAGNICLDRKHRIITPKDINIGVRGDEELQKLMSSACISQGSNPTGINEALVQKKKGKK
jgi:histone H2A